MEGQTGQGAQHSQAQLPEWAEVIEGDFREARTQMQKGGSYLDRINAVKSFGKLGASNNLTGVAARHALLIALQRDEHQLVRAAAAESLARFDAPALLFAVSGLLSALRADDYYVVRQNVAKVLAVIVRAGAGDAAVKAALAQAADDDNHRIVRIEASAALQRTRAS